MAAEAERHHLEGDVGPLADLYQVFQLLAHDRPVAVGAAQRGLVEDDVEAGGAFGDEEFLPFQAERDPPVDLGGARPGHAPFDHRVRVRLGLEQAVHELHLVDADE